MHPLHSLTRVAIVIYLCASPILRAESQAASNTPATTRTNETPLERWIHEPTAITLTADQAKHFDGLRAKYAADIKKLKEATRGDRMGAIEQVRQLLEVSKDSVRAILSSSQRVVFDKNIEATKERRDPNGPLNYRRK
ncbi:MAG TPA: hypothetical protein VK636_04160 [Gemmatimonadaceae bacterium]|nr:hypothetical protein [Gemmatimonadaceae bacterium]